MARREDALPRWRRIRHRALQNEVEARKAAGIPGDYLQASELREQFGIERTGAILSAGSAPANPVQLAAGLLRRAVTQGYASARRSPSRRLRRTDGVILTTDDDVEITRRAVFCTGYEILKPIPDQGHTDQLDLGFRLCARRQVARVVQRSSRLGRLGPLPLSPAHAATAASSPAARTSPSPKRTPTGHCCAKKRARLPRRSAPDPGAEIPHRASLGRFVRRQPDRSSLHRRGAGPSELLRGDGLWRQRHHLRDDRRRGGSRLIAGEKTRMRTSIDSLATVSSREDGPESYPPLQTQLIVA